MNMNLDDPRLMQATDPQNMLSEINNLPEQLATAWKLGLEKPLPDRKCIKQVVIAGMGGSAIAADLLAAYLYQSGRVPVFVHRDYGLPAWACGSETLLVASSHSGNTEETLDAFETGIKNQCNLMVISTGGRLVERAREAGAPVWLFNHNNQPRAAVGFSFGYLLALMTRLELAPDQADQVASTIRDMRTQQESLGPLIPVSQNPAKRLAGQLAGRWINIIGSGMLAPVARRWKGQFNELAKAGAGFDCLPEADHNTLAGLTNPEKVLNQTATIFLNGSFDHPRNQLRIKLTKQAFMLAGLNTNDYSAPGNTPLAQQWCALHFGDHLAYYLAMSYGEDPTPIPSIQEFKQHLG